MCRKRTERLPHLKFGGRAKLNRRVQSVVVDRFHRVHEDWQAIYFTLLATLAVHGRICLSTPN